MKKSNTSLIIQNVLTMMIVIVIIIEKYHLKHIINQRLTWAFSIIHIGVMNDFLSRKKRLKIPKGGNQNLLIEEGQTTQ